MVNPVGDYIGDILVLVTASCVVLGSIAISIGSIIAVVQAHEEEAR